jgi:hypothetical protein
MKQFIRCFLIGAISIAGVSGCVVQQRTPPRMQYHPEAHPAYLHALSDLRAARWLIAHRAADNYAMGQDELLALDEIAAATQEIKHASIDDGKDLNDHPPIDAHLNRSGRLHEALELLRKVRNDVGREEDDPRTRELQHRALEHIDVALHAVERSLADLDR